MTTLDSPYVAVSSSVKNDTDHRLDGALWGDDAAVKTGTEEIAS